MEEWKQISFDDRYYISNMGNVVSYAYGKRKVLKPVLHNTGYKFIRIKRKLWLIHRLVAMMFIPNDNDVKNHIDHIDGDKLNNRVENLRWVTQKENNNNPITRGRISANNKGRKRTAEQKERMRKSLIKMWERRKANGWIISESAAEKLRKKHKERPPMLGRFKENNPNSKKVIMYNSNGEVVGVFANSLAIQEQFDIKRESVCRCCNGKQSTSKGYKFQYVK